MNSINMIDTLLNSPISKNGVCEIPKELADQLQIGLDGCVNTADLIRVAYWSACQAELQEEETIKHLDLMDKIFNPQRAVKKRLN